jgi:hypothetical protein
MTRVMMIHGVLHVQGPSSTRRIPVPTSTCPECLESWTVKRNVSKYDGNTESEAVRSFFIIGNRTKNGPMEATTLITCRYMSVLYNKCSIRCTLFVH